MFELDYPIQLKTNFILHAVYDSYDDGDNSELLIDTLVLSGAGLVIDSPHDLYENLLRLDMIRLTLEDYAEELAAIRSMYPVVVNGRVYKDDWEQILKYFDDDHQKAKKWVEDFVKISKG